MSASDLIEVVDSVSVGADAGVEVAGGATCGVGVLPMPALLFAPPASACRN